MESARRGFRDNYNLRDHQSRGCQPSRYDQGAIEPSSEMEAGAMASLALRQKAQTEPSVPKKDSQVIVISDDKNTDDEHADEGMLVD